ncbi:hypothetical protein [Krasilnikovia sp. M28-CT-15]|uniref:hypothetical protein n=1 Tax=Krasilnikovia sp. M28-CT-15 TaxID=3373540 RepID=UPI00399D00EE
MSVLYPFRPSFCQHFGFVGLSRWRTATFAPEGLALPPSSGAWLRVGFDDYQARCACWGERHGFSVFDEIRTAEFRESPHAGPGGRGDVPGGSVGRGPRRGSPCSPPAP